jgi:hypothetical protein
LQALRTGRYHAPDWMDYGRVLNELRLLQRVEQGDCDEVWFFGAPGFGFYESRMAGRGAFWCNAPACENTDVCRKRFVLMGFSYERAVAKGEVAAPFEAQRQALDREEQAQLADLRHKLALRVQIKLLNVLHVIQPKLRLYVQLIPAQGSGGEIEIVFDPALQKIEAPVCPMCARPTLALALTRSSQVVCPACATQSLGQRPAKSS